MDSPEAPLFLQLLSAKEVALQSEVLSGVKPPCGSIVHGLTLHTNLPSASYVSCKYKTGQRIP